MLLSRKIGKPNNLKFWEQWLQITSITSGSITLITENLIFVSILSIIRKLYKSGSILYLIITPKDEQMNYPFLFVPSY